MLSHREIKLWWLTRLNPRLRFALPGDRAAPCSLVSGSRARPGRGCPSGGAPGAPVWWSVLVFRAPAPLGPWWVGLVGRGLSGRAGWSRALACLSGGGAGWCVAPPSFGGLGGVAGLCAGFGASPSPIIKIFPPAGVALLWACAVGRVVGLCVRVALCPAPPWTRPVRGGGAGAVSWLCLWCLRVGVGVGCSWPPAPAPSAVPRESACPRAKCGAGSAERGGRRSPGGGGPSRGAGIWRACSARAALAGGNPIQKVLSVGARSERGRFAQGTLSPRLGAGSVRLQLRY